MAKISSKRSQSYRLLKAEMVELSPKKAEILRQHLEFMNKIGFSIAEFGGDTFVVDAIPICLQEVSLQVLIPDLAASLEEAGERADSSRLLEEHIAQASCKAAVKAHNPLTLEEIETLVKQLAKTRMPYTCPHGRPTLIHISWQEMDKKFGRL